MNWLVVRLTTFICASWILAFLLFGGSSAGHEWYLHRSQDFFHDSNGGLPMLVLTLPIIITGTVASLLSLANHNDNNKNNNYSSMIHYNYHRSMLPHWIQQLYVKFQQHTGNPPMQTFITAFMILPLLIFTITTIQRHFLSEQLSFDYKIMYVANAFAIAAVMALAFVLLPVGRRNPLVESTTYMIWHIWAGRCVIIGGTLHGVLHMYRWVAIAGEPLRHMLIPPVQCWKQPNDFTPTCQNSTTKCTCYHLFRNMMGCVAAIALTIIAISTLHSVRRRMYAFFYKTHVITGPMMILAVMLHWNRSILYLTGAIVWYLAASLPQRIEIRRGTGTQIDKVEPLLLTGTRCDCVSVTFHATETAVQQFRPGQYVRLLAPHISSHSHPFTINQVPGSTDQLRILFRVTGPFTRQLAESLCSDNLLPKVQLDGFYGTPLRLRQLLQHDVVSIVAGGIGITPYLSLLHHIFDHGDEHDRTRKVVLHWVCRETSLIEYVKREYLEPLQQRKQEADYLRIDIVIYKTAPTSEVSPFSLSLHSDVERGTETPRDAKNKSIGTPFAISHFARKTTYMSNLPISLSFFLTSWIGFAGCWYIYSNIQQENVIFTRVLAPCVLVALGLAVAYATSATLSIFSDEYSPKIKDHWTLLKNEEDALELRTVMSEIEEDMSVADSRPAFSESSSRCRPHVSIEEREGRPSIHQFFNILEESKYPGIFSCGPAPLMKEIRKNVEERCLLRFQRCISGDPIITLHEDQFQI